MSAPLLLFEDVGFSYGDDGYRALAEMDLAIEEGEVTAILGPNGAGKTTLLYMALGWLKPQQGRVLLAGKPLGAYTRQQLGRLIGLVPQVEHISFDFSVLDYVLLGRAPYLPPLGMPSGEDYAAAKDAMRLVGISKLAGRSVLSLSGGEKQLVLIARALAQHPRLLLLDEPTTHLDLGNKGRLVELLRELNRSGASIVLTTHEPDVAAVVASRLLLVQNGRVLAGGPVREVMTSAELSRVYGLEVDVTEVQGRPVVLWG
jgi:iron complex transport system ATP-binding protein